MDMDIIDSASLSKSLHLVHSDQPTLNPMPSPGTYHAADGNLLEKLELTFPEHDQNAESCKLQLRCCSVKSTLKRVGGLLVFHPLNVAVAIAGVLLAVLMFAGLLLSLGLVGISIVMAVGAVPIVLLWVVIPDRWMILSLVISGVLAIGYLVLFVYPWFNVYMVFAPYTLLFGGFVGILLFYLSFYSILLVVKIDVRLANFATRTVHSKSATEDLEPKDCETIQPRHQQGPCQGCVVFPDRHADTSLVASSFLFRYRKVLVGAMSAATVFFAVVQPAMSLFSGGDAPLYAQSMTWHQSPLLYVGIVASTWAFGAVGMLVVAALSVKLTTIVLSGWELKQIQGGATEITTQTSPRAAFVELSVASSPTAVTTSL
ncbi:hypothetical protein V7S43_002599 [Phytophthora oleae]|uniref:Transmembrane protein n=1 Tax=Phytophthora oleae TaxID=2107226 RepID=A0ABD3G143_9STRA